MPSPDRRNRLIAIIATVVFHIVVLVIMLCAYLRYTGEQPRKWPPQDTSEILYGGELIVEGNIMHHCVGGYVNRVVEGECYICFVRHKDTPDNCYITCQVYTNGQIGQYFLAHDRYITTEEDKDFKAAFQMHLARVWDN